MGATVFFLTCFLFLTVVYLFSRFMQIYNTNKDYLGLIPFYQPQVTSTEFPQYSDIIVKDDEVSAMDLYRTLQNDNEARIIGSTFKPNTFTMTEKGQGDFVNFDTSALDSYGAPRSYKFVIEGEYDSLQLPKDLSDKIKSYSTNPTEAKSISIRNELEQLFSVENTKYKAPENYYDDRNFELLPVS